MFYSRRETGPSLLRFLLMFIVALGLALYFAVTDTAYDRAGVMLAAALLCGGYFLWQALQFDSAYAVREKMVQRLRDVWN